MMWVQLCCAPASPNPHPTPPTHTGRSLHTLTVCMSAVLLPPQVVQVPVPPLRKGTVLVDVKAAGVNPLDVKVGAGRGQAFGHCV